MKLLAKKMSALSILALALSACSHFNQRSISSDDDIDYILNTFEGQESALGINECRTSLTTLYKNLFNLSRDISIKYNFTKPELDGLIEKSFLNRLKIKDKMPDYAKDKDCFRAAADVTRSLRYLEDYLLEIRHQKFPDTKKVINLNAASPYLLINPKFKDSFHNYKDLQSGDIIISRGNRFISATIARIAQMDHQFSHVSMIYVDEKTKEIETVEAHIEIGSVVKNIDYHIESGNVRSLVLRHKNREVAKKAAKLIRDKVKKEQWKNKNIQYDFAMDGQENSKLFCSEIAIYAFKMASPEYANIPTYKSRFAPKSRSFLNSIGIPLDSESIKTFDVVAPGDFQFDPEFEMVAEWRNPNVTEENRFSDFIMTKVLNKVEEEAYQFDSSIKLDAKAKTIWLLRRLPVVREFLKNKLPTNMTVKQLEFIFALDLVGDQIKSELTEISKKYENPMTPKEIYLEIDNIFNEDFKRYKSYKANHKVGNFTKEEKPHFYLLFNPQR